MNNIIYSAIIREKHVILCEYTEYTGNYNQMLINYIKLIQNSSNKSFKSKNIIGNYQIFCIKDNIIYYVLFTSASEKNEENNFFSFLISIKNILLNKLPLSELKNKKPFSLKNFLPVLKSYHTPSGIKNFWIVLSINGSDFFTIGDINIEEPK